MKTKSKAIDKKFPPYLTSHTDQKKLRKYAADEKVLKKVDKVSIIPFIMIGKPKEIQKKNLSWPQAKRRDPKLDPYKDSDKDGTINLLDNRPFNKTMKGGTQK